MTPLVDVPQRLTKLRPEVWAALGCAVALLLYGNLTSVFSHDTRGRFLLWSNLGVMTLLLAWAFGAARMTARDVGLSLRSAPASAAVGAALSLLASVPPVMFLVLAPLFNGSPVEAPDITERSGPSMTYFLLFRQPVGTALFEEVAFRGVLYSAWCRVGGDRTAFLATSSVFALWHLVISSRSVAESGVVSGAPMVTLGVIVSLAGLWVGGFLFAYLRWRTGSIAAPVVAHWLIVAPMALTVWALG